MSVLALPSKATTPAAADPGWVASSARAPQPTDEVAAAADEDEALTREWALAGQAQWRDEVAATLDRLVGLVGEPGLDPAVAEAARAAEWIATNDVPVAALFPTHDSAERAPKGQIAWFDAEADLDETAAYDDAPRGIVVRAPTTVGESADGGLRLFWGHGTDRLAEVVAHEVQHLIVGREGEAERPDEDRAGACADRAEDQHFAGYYSEFEAYWLDARLPDAAGEGGTRRVTASVDGREVSRTLTFANARQLAIFERLCGGDLGRTFTRDASLAYWWAPYFAACDPTFAGFVEALETFGGTNAMDSVRIDRLLAAIEAGRDWHPQAEALLPEEAAWLADGSASAGFWARVDAAPDGARVHAELAQALSARARAA